MIYKCCILIFSNRKSNVIPNRNFHFPINQVFITIIRNEKASIPLIIIGSFNSYIKCSTLFSNKHMFIFLCNTEISRIYHRFLIIPVFIKQRNIRDIKRIQI